MVVNAVRARIDLPALMAPRGLRPIVNEQVKVVCVDWNAQSPPFQRFLAKQCPVRAGGLIMCVPG